MGESATPMTPRDRIEYSTITNTRRQHVGTLDR